MIKLIKKGFTLVELLAVIVILALLLVVVANNALPAMNNAKKNSLEVYAKRVVDQAKGLYASAEISISSVTQCSESSGVITCTFTDIKQIMGNDVDTSYSLVGDLVVTKNASGYNITGAVTGAGFTTTITSSSGKVNYATS